MAGPRAGGPRAVTPARLLTPRAARPAAPLHSEGPLRVRRTMTAAGRCSTGATTTAATTRRWERWRARCRANTAPTITTARRTTSAAGCGTRRAVRASWWSRRRSASRSPSCRLITRPCGSAASPTTTRTICITPRRRIRAATWWRHRRDDGSAPPPDGSADPNAQGGAYPQGAPQAPSDLIIYPKQGQSKDQQAADEYECHNWAKGQTGFDPTQASGGVAPGDADRAHSNYDRAMAACLQGRGYQVN